MKKCIRWVLLVLILALLCSCAPAAPAEPSAPEQTEKPTESAPQTEQEPVADNLLLDKNVGANDSVLPRGVDEKSAWLKELEQQELIMYYTAQSDAFYYTVGKSKVSETAWFQNLAEKYDIHLRVIRKDPRSSLAAQRLALLSSAQLDILSFTPAQLPFAMNMTADATDLMASLKVTNTDFLNQSILTYGGAGNRFFSPVGVARNLWYTTGASSNPRALAKSGMWTLRAFTNFVAERTKTEGDNVAVYGYESHDFADFMTALGTPMIEYDAHFVSNTDTAKDNLKTLQQLNIEKGHYYNGLAKNKVPALTDGTLAMRYGQTPFVADAEKYPAFDWAPLPAPEHQKGALSACAPILALPKEGGKNRASLCAALLWSARFADANHDLLRFTYGMSFESWTEYYHATNKQLQIVYTDENNALLLRRLLSAPTFEEDDYKALKDSAKQYCINANERLANDR